MKDTPTSVDREKQIVKYQSYLLRLWQTVNAGQPSWQASLQEPRTGQRFGFASLEELFAFLIKRTEGDGKRRSDESKTK